VRTFPSLKKKTAGLGFGATCKISKAFLRGRLIVDGDQWLGKDGYGEYLPRSASGLM
jgi:dihydropyrimidinase